MSAKPAAEFFTRPGDFLALQRDPFTNRSMFLRVKSGTV